MADGAYVVTMPCHWAVFGEVERQHGLINSSLPLEMHTQLESMKALSDRPSSEPPPGTLLTPYLCGFPYSEWYVLMRTFLDPNAKRGGMVRSFCLLLPINEVESIDDLSVLIDQLPATNSLPIDWNNWEVSSRRSISVDSCRPPADIAALTPLSMRLGLIIALLINQPPAVWSGSQDDFESALTGVWALLFSKLRSSLRFGRSYSRNDIGIPIPHLVTTPNSAAPRWTQTGIVQTPDRKPNSRVEALLLGHSSATSLRQFLSSLPAISEFSKLQMADSCLTAFEAFKSGERGMAITAARLLKELAPNPHQAEELKVILVDALENILQTADTNDVRRFSNLNLDAFISAKGRCERSLTVWVWSNIETSHVINGEFVEIAFYEKTASWWKNAVSSVLAEHIRKLSPGFARRLWDWWLTSPSLVLRLKEYFPNNADQLLCEAAPTQMAKESTNSLLEIFSEDIGLQSRGFPRLLTYLRVMSHIPNEQILEACLALPNNVETALEILRQCIGNKVYLDLALTTSDERVLIEAGICCFHEPELLNQIIPSNASWRIIWLATIRLGADPLAGIYQPIDVVAAILDQLLMGIVIDKELLISLSKTHSANLVDYRSRPKIWSALPSHARSGFLEATAKGIFDRWCYDSDFQPEPELVQNVLKPGCFSEVIQRTTRDLDKMTSNYMAFLVLEEGSISNAQEVVTVLCNYSLTIPEIEIQKFAAWIRKNNWTQIAETAFGNYQQKTGSKELYILAEHTLEILPNLKKLEAIIELQRPTAQNDFYATLRDVLSHLFSSGPNADGFWEDIGGKSGDLKVHGTVSEMWYSALNTVQRGKVPLNQLLRVARQRYPHDLNLKELERFSYRLRT